MKKSLQAGFTMIELIVVIVILGVLAATALPKFIDMRSNAEQAAADGFAGAANAAMNLNYSGCALMNNAPTANKCVTVADCATVGSLLQGGLGAYAAGVATSGTVVAMGSVNGVTGTCEVSKTSGGTTYKSLFTGVAAGN